MNKKIRGAVFVRSKGRCEACDRTLGPGNEIGHLDHFWGRAKAPESVENCLALCIECDHNKTNSRPSSVYWLRLFRDHCRKYRYEAEFNRAQTRIAVLKQKGLAA